MVSGASGFIGSHLVEALIGRGYRVIGLDRQSARPRPGYTHVTQDLADDLASTCVPDMLRGADVVFHLAGMPGVRGSGSAVEAMRWNDNVVSTWRILSLTPATTPAVVTSSSSVYGGAGAGGRGLIASSERHPLRPRGGYARSKVAAERLCERRRAAGGVVAVIRPFTVAGEGQRPDMAFATWLEAARVGRPLTIFGSATRSRDITDVRDAVEGLIRAAEREVNDVVNLGTGRGHRLVDMARALLAVSGLSVEIVVGPAAAEEAESTLADTTRCQELLGFVPETDLEELLARQVGATAMPPALVAT